MVSSGRSQPTRIQQQCLSTKHQGDLNQPTRSTCCPHFSMIAWFKQSCPMVHDVPVICIDAGALLMVSCYSCMAGWQRSSKPTCPERHCQGRGTPRWPSTHPSGRLPCTNSKARHAHKVGVYCRVSPTLYVIWASSASFFASITCNEPLSSLLLTLIFPETTEPSIIGMIMPREELRGSLCFNLLEEVLAYVTTAAGIQSVTACYSY